MPASCPAGSLTWAQNAQGQDPCFVASRLISNCGGPHDMPPVPSKGIYPIPSGDLAKPCACSSPIYFLVSACADCQGGTWTSWAQWTAKCSNPTENSYPKPVPGDTSIPSFALFSVQQFPSFDPVNMEADLAPAPAPVNPAPQTPSPVVTVSSLSQLSPTPTPSITDSSTLSSSDSSSNSLSATTSGSSDSSLPTSSDSSASSITSSDGSSQSTSNTKSQLPTLGAGFSSDPSQTLGSNVNPTQPPSSAGGITASGESKSPSHAGSIAGGVVGSLIFLILGGLLLSYIIRRRQRKRIAPSTAYLASLRAPGSLSAEALARRSDSQLILTANDPYHDEELLTHGPSSMGHGRGS